MSMTSRAQRILVALCLAVPLAGVSAPGQAATSQSWSRTDRVGDAVAQADIKRVTATWTTKMHTTRVRVRNLGKRGELRVAIGHEGEIYHAVIVKKSRVTKRIATFSYDGPSASWPCPQMKVAWDAQRNLITVRTPISACIGGGSSNLTIGARLVARGSKDVVGQVPFRSE